MTDKPKHNPKSELKGPEETYLRVCEQFKEIKGRYDVGGYPRIFNRTPKTIGEYDKAVLTTCIQELECAYQSLEKTVEKLATDSITLAPHQLNKVSDIKKEIEEYLSHFQNQNKRVPHSIEYES